MTLRLLGLLSFVLVAACSGSTTPAEAPPADAPAPTPAAGRLFVTNESAGTITVIDVAARKTLATIPVGKRPRGIRLSPDGERVFVALSGSPIAPPGVDEDTLPPADKKADGIGIVNVKTLMLERVVPGGSDPEQTALSRDGTKLFIANEDVGEASVINVADGKVLGTFRVGGEPEGVDLRPDGQVVYVTSEEDSQVAVIDAVGLKLVKTFKVGPRPALDGVSARQLACLRQRRERRLRLRRGRAEARRAESHHADRRHDAAHGRGDLARRLAPVHQHGPWQAAGDRRHGEQCRAALDRSRRAPLGRRRVA
jgi:YVTN family beta-propeller protein